MLIIKCGIEINLKNHKTLCTRIGISPVRCLAINKSNENFFASACQQIDNVLVHTARNLERSLNSVLRESCQKRK